MRPAFLAIAGPQAAVDALVQARGWPELLPEGWEVPLRLPGLLVFAAAPETPLCFAKARYWAIFWTGRPHDRFEEAMRSSSRR